MESRSEVAGRPEYGGRDSSDPGLENLLARGSATVNASFFYAGVGKIKSCIAEWQDRLKKVYAMAGIPDGHSHRLRDTLAVDLLNSGVLFERCYLGHKS